VGGFPTFAETMVNGEVAPEERRPFGSYCAASCSIRRYEWRRRDSGNHHRYEWTADDRSTDFPDGGDDLRRDAVVGGFPTFAETMVNGVVDQRTPRREPSSPRFRVVAGSFAHSQFSAKVNRATPG
jgi:hypothetical protein